MKTMLIILMLIMLAVVLIIPVTAMWISSLFVDPEKLDPPETAVFGYGHHAGTLKSTYPRIRKGEGTENEEGHVCLQSCIEFRSAYPVYDL